MIFIPPMLCSRLENPALLADRRYNAELSGRAARLPVATDPCHTQANSHSREELA